MIRINLLTVERQRPKKKFAGFQVGQKLTVVCSLILVGAALFCLWRMWALRQHSVQLDADIASAQQETTRLRSIINQVQQFEQQKAQLQERVALIEQLRKDQTGPVHMLDQISRSLPTMLWLTDLKQGATASEVILEGRCTTMTGLSDFVANLEASGYFKKSVEIVMSEVLTIQTPPGELIRFSIKAQFQQPGDPAKAAAAAPAPAPPKQGR